MADCCGSYANTVTPTGGPVASGVGCAEQAYATALPDDEPGNPSLTRDDEPPFSGACLDGEPIRPRVLCGEPALAPEVGGRSREVC
jgi:hypothetical protein